MSKISKLYMVKCGGMVTPDHFASARNTTREYKKIINICLYVLEHPEKGLILLDTGVSVETISEELLAELAGLQPNILKQLARIGKTADDVKHICLSHMHADHCSQCVFFPDAVYHIREKEWEGVHDANCKGFHEPDRIWVREFEARSKNIELIPDVPEYDIFGDGSVISIDTKGHTPGHQSFLVNFESGREMMLTMDAAHCEDELYDERYFIKSTWDIPKSLEAVKLLKDYREKTGNPLYMLHDSYQWYDMKQFPEYYE